MSKKNVHSILTTAMLNAEGAEKETAAPAEETIQEPEGFAADRKRFLKRAVIATLATAAVTALAIRVFGSDDEDGETDSED